MIIECTRECLEFIIVLSVLIGGFALATFYRQILLHEEGADSLPLS
jgi:hypothetical protein